MKRIALVLAVVFLAGCMAQNLPMTSTLNDFVAMSTKTNSKEKIYFEYKSNITDGKIIPVGKDRGEKQSMHPGFGHSESSTLGRMLNEYIENKFSNSSSDGETRITVVLKDFWIEQYSTDSSGKIMMAGMFGGEINTVLRAKVKVQFILNREGKEDTKIITSTAEDVFIFGTGTGTSTSSFDRGRGSIEHVHARNINKANNKIIMLLNSYLEENGL